MRTGLVKPVSELEGKLSGIEIACTFPTERRHITPYTEVSPMLVLTRKLNEEIVIGDNIRITIVEVAPGRVKIGVSAPKSVRVDRAEIHEKKQQEASTPTPAPIADIITNRIADVLPQLADAHTVVPATAAPVEHSLPANRLSALRRRFPKKPR